MFEKWSFFLPAKPKCQLNIILFKGYEDWKRHQADKEVNNRMYELVSPHNGSLISVISRDIKVSYTFANMN